MRKQIYLYELIFMFLLSGLIYSLLEICFRGFTHWTMTILGGICGCGLYIISLMGGNSYIKALYGALMITVLEMVTGILVNIVFAMKVWDYSDVPFNFMGQICLPFTLLWYFISLGAMYICSAVRALFMYRTSSDTIIPENNSNCKLS